MKGTPIRVLLKDVKAAPWRFSEDLALRHQATRYYTSIQKNIVHSLESDGQFAPIHVRPLGTGGYEIVDGHIVGRIMSGS
jgi:ParB-like nuclease domain